MSRNPLVVWLENLWTIGGERGPRCAEMQLRLHAREPKGRLRGFCVRTAFRAVSGRFARDGRAVWARFVYKQRTEMIDDMISFVTYRRGPVCGGGGVVSLSGGR
jgi:hypothetical protein